MWAATANRPSITVFRKSIEASPWPAILAIEKPAFEFLMSDASVFHQRQITSLVANVIQQRVCNNIRITKEPLFYAVTESIQRRSFVAKHRVGLGQFVRNLAIAQSAVFDF